MTDKPRGAHLFKNGLLGSKWKRIPAIGADPRSPPSRWVPCHRCPLCASKCVNGYMKSGTLYKHLRIVPKRRRKRYNSHDSRGRLQGKRMIEERPPEIEHRTSIGHWEGDTVIGSDRHHCIVTLVERMTGFLIIKKIKARSVEEVNKACMEAIREHERNFKTITFDNGTEFHGYKKLEEAFPVICYFAHPYHSWERGTNENTNGLIRQYIPKKSCMKSISQTDCDRIAYKLNTRPRKRLGFKTPYELYYRTGSPLHFEFELPRYIGVRFFT